MGGVGVGLATGIDYATIIEGLLQIEQQPLEKIRDKINLNEIKQRAYDQLNGLALTAKLSMFDLSSKSTFDQKTATSSNESILTATASTKASVGSHSIKVNNLATSAVTLSSGLADQSTTTVGSGKLTFELGGKRLDQGTFLDDLNDGDGVQRGVVAMTDSNGKSESFNLASAVTVQDAFDILNANSFGVTFAVDRTIALAPSEPSYDGYKVKVTNSGSNSITLSDVGTSTTLSDLGLKSSTSKTITGNGGTSSGISNVYYVTEGTKLNQINDGNGIDTNASGTKDIRFYVKDTLANAMKSVEVDLSTATDIGDVLNSINAAIFDAKLNQYTKAVLSSDGVSIEFTGEVDGFKNINGSRAATDLGLDKMQLVGSVYKGEAMIAEMNSSFIRNLNGGNGIENLEEGVFKIQSRRGDVYSINMDRAVSVQDIIRNITNAEANGSNNAKTFIGAATMSTGTNTLTDTVNIVSGTSTIELDRIVGATITINTGGTDYTATVASYDTATNKFTFSTTNDNITGSAADIVNDGYTITYSVLTDITASINENGNGLKVSDSSSGDNTFRIDDVTGDVAKQLGIETTFSVDPVMFNPIDLTNDSTGVLRRSAVFLREDALPDGITENDMVGRSVEHVYASRTDLLAGTPSSDQQAIESAKIIAFEKAPDGFEVTSVQATASSSFSISSADQTSLYGGNEDKIIDSTNLDLTNNTAINSEFMVGATLNVFTSSGKISSTIIKYDSSEKSIALADDTISSALSSSQLQALGYSISYNHKLVLDHSKKPATFAGAATMDQDTVNTIDDTVNLVANSTTIDLDRLIGATVTVRKSGVDYSAIVKSYDTAANRMTFESTTDNITANITTPELQANGYTITYTPIQFANHGSNNFLSDHSGDPDYIRIVGASSSGDVTGENLENRMISKATRLDDLNGGKGITKGTFTIAAGGVSAEINTNQDSIQTVGDLITLINSQISSIAVEINDRGDGLRVYDIASSQTTSSLAITNLNNGTTATDLNLLNTNLNQRQISVSSGSDFKTLSGTVTTATASEHTTDIVVSAFAGLNMSDVIGGKITYTDTALGGTGKKAHAIVVDYNALTGTLTIAGQVSESKTGGTFDISKNTTGTESVMTGDTVNLTFKQHLPEYEYFGNVTDINAHGVLGGDASSPNGAFEVDLNTATIDNYTNLTEEELIGSMVNFYSTTTGASTGYEEVKGFYGMITSFDSATSKITVQSSDMNFSKLDALATESTPLKMAISRDIGVTNQVQAGHITSTSSYLRNVASAGFVSLTANVDRAGSSTTIISDDFANLDATEVVGSLVTIATQANSSKVGHTAVVTGYDSKAKAITIGGFYNSSGTLDNVTMGTNETVHLTYASELTNSVIRSTSASIRIADSTIGVGGANTAQVVAGANTTTTIQISNLDNSTDGANGNLEKLVGQKVTFSTLAGGASTEEATIQAVTENYNGVSGATVITFDSALSATPAAGDAFSITMSIESISSQVATNKRLIRVDNIQSANATNGSVDELIGSEIEFYKSTPTATLQSEKRTIIDVLHDYGGTVGQTMLVLDEELPDAPTVSDDFLITQPEITATIEKIDFSTGVITTRDHLASSMGNRSFNIHPVVDGTFQKNVQVFSTDTLVDVQNRINAAKVGVNASIINDGNNNNPFRLSLTAESSGKAGAVTVASGITNFTMSLATKAQDAKIIVGDGTASSSVISSSTNTVVDGIAGVTLDLKSASSESVTLTLDHDKEGITDKATTVIEEINALLTAANSLTALETDVEVTNADGTVTTEKQKGVLFGDVAARSMITSIKSLLSNKLDSVSSGELAFFSDIGIKLDSTGTLFEFDDSVLTAALNSKFDQVKNLFTYTPSITSGSSIGLVNNFLQTGYDINHIRNGDTSKSGFSEAGNGINGVKLQGGTNKYFNINLGEAKSLYGIRFHHTVPTNLTAKYAVSATEASIGNAAVVKSGSGSRLTDTSYLSSDNGLIASQLVGATITIGSLTSTVSSYDAGTSSLTLSTDISSATPQTTGYSITTAAGKTLSFSYNAKLEYKDPVTGLYKTYQNFSNLADGSLSVVFPGNLNTDELRVSYLNNTGDSEDFTTNGYFARLLEFDVLEAQGLGQKFNSTFDNITNAQTGSLQQANATLQSVNDSYTNQITRISESIEKKQTSLIKEFQNLELIVSNLNSQSSFLQSQLSGLPKAFSYRGNNS